MPWDCMCPNCSGMVISSMTDNEELMEEGMKVIDNLWVVCYYCGTVFDTSTNEIKGKRHKVKDKSFSRRLISLWLKKKKVPLAKNLFLFPFFFYLLDSL